MLKSRDMVICTVAGAILLSLAIGPSHAALFDFLKLKRAANAKTTSRGQTPGWQPSGESAVSAPADTNSALPSGWGYDSSPCFNCGDCDHYVWCTERHRRKCGETWYPRLAPYCQASWGWTQPCWRRMADNYNCPRPQGPASTPNPVPPPPAPPAAEPAPTIPEPPPPATSSRARPPRAPYASRPAGFTSSSRPVARQFESPVRPEAIRSEAIRSTSSAHTLARAPEPEPEADEAPSVDDETLESQMEAPESDNPESEVADGEVPEGEALENEIPDCPDNEAAEGETSEEEREGAEDSTEPPDFPE